MKKKVQTIKHINIDRLKEAIMKNDETKYFISDMIPLHYNLPDEDFYHLLPRWLKTKPVLKSLILETTQFRLLPEKIQFEVIKSAVKYISEGKFLIRYFPQSAIKKIYKDHVEAAYRVLIEDIFEFDRTRGRIITPPLDIEEVEDMFVPLYVAYPSNVPLAVLLYKFISTLRYIKENKSGLIEQIELKERSNIFPIDCKDVTASKEKINKVLKDEKLTYLVCKEVFQNSSFFIINFTYLLIK